MRGIKTIRKRYKLNQSEMADYLGISRSLLSLVELGYRCLSFDALQKLSLLGVGYEKHANAAAACQPLPGYEADQLNFREQANKILVETDNKIAALQFKLDKLSNAHQQCRIQLSGIKQLLNHASKQGDAVHQKILENRQVETTRKAASCDASKQILLAIKLHALKLESRLLEKLLQTPDSNGFTLFDNL